MSDELRSHLHQARADIERQLEATKAQFDATQERINKRTGRNLFGAIGIGLAGGGLLLVSLLVSKELFVVFAMAMVGFASFELATALKVGGYRVPRWAVGITAVAVLPVTWIWGYQGQFWALIAAMFVSALARVLTQLGSSRTNTPQLLQDLGATVFVQSYVTALGSCAVLLTSEPNGQWWTLSVIVLAILSDTGAYAAGLAWGSTDGAGD